MGVLEGVALVQWVNASCVAQGLPLLVSDVGVIAKVCTLLRGSPPGPERSLLRRDPADVRSEAPLESNSVGVEGSDAPHARGDDGMVEDCTDDG